MKKRSRTEYSLLNVITGVSGYFFNTLLGFICRIVFVKYLSAEYLGVNGLFTDILLMLSLAELGVGNAIVYALYKPLADEDEEKIASLMSVYAKAYRVIGIIIGIIGVALIPFIKIIIHEQPQISESIYLLYCINLFNTASTYFFSYRSSLLIASQRNYLVSGINYVITVVQSIVQIITLMLFQKYLVYLLIQSIGIFAYNVIVSRVALRYFPFLKRKKVKELPGKEKKRLFLNVRDLMIYKVSGLLVNSTDNILITFFGGLATTGITSNYTLLINTINSLLNQVFNGLTASIGNHNASKNNEERYKMFKFLNFMNFWIYGWVAVGVLFCSSNVVQICFGKEYVLHRSIPIILAINFYTSGVTNIIGTYKHTLGLFRQGRFIQVFTGILNIILSIVLGNVYGLFGILLATGISRACTHLWYTPYVVFKYGFKIRICEYWKCYLKYFLITVMAGVLCEISFQIISGSLLVRTILKILICSIIFNVVFVIAQWRTAELKKMLYYVRTIFKI